MAATANSRPAPNSSAETRQSGALAALLLCLLSAGAVWYCFAKGWVLWCGDAEAHLNTARRVFDSQTPGYNGLATAWLPLLHVLTMPFAYVDAWWHSGLAGSFAPALSFVAGGVFLFLAAQRIFRSAEAAWTAVALAALNPNLLYLQSTCMTEGMFFGALMALLYYSVRFRDKQEWQAAVPAGIAASAASLIRYEGWFIIPFAAAWFLFAAKRQRLRVAMVFGLLASAGPLYWLAHNWYLTRDMLDFLHGPYSAAAIQGDRYYPGKNDWRLAFLYFRTAAKLCAGPGLPIVAMAGAVAALARRAVWPLVLLALPCVFYIWSMHSAGTPILVPSLWPHAYYNIRYGLAALPLLALASAALVTVVPRRMRVFAAVLIVIAGTAHWAARPGPENWVTWNESRIKFEKRGAWTRQTAEYLRPRFVPGSGIVSATADDFAAVYRSMGIPLRETLTLSNGAKWQAVVKHPELKLWHQWAIVRHGDDLSRALDRAARFGIRYRLVQTIAVKETPVIEIYRRVSGEDGAATFECCSGSLAHGAP
jgi:hypothetical protein